MDIIKVGNTYGKYKVLSKYKTGAISRIGKYECVCIICGSKKTYSSSTLGKMKTLNKCVCYLNDAKKAEITRDYKQLKKNWGNVNICVYCEHFPKCKIFKNIIDKRMVKKYKIEKLSDYNKKRNIILVYECDGFKYDWRGYDEK